MGGCRGDRLSAIFGLLKEATPPPAPYRARLELDLPLMGLALASTASLLAEIPPPQCLPDCTPGGVNALDRTVVGGFSASALMVANVLVGLLVAAPLAWELRLFRDRRFWSGAWIAALALMLVQGATQLMKFAVGRNAPFVYTPDQVPESALLGMDAARSFPSGHTSTAFAAATLLVIGYWLRRPRSPSRWGVLVGGLLTASAAGTAKVFAGYHYWTDILAGGLLGASIAALVALTHRPGASADP